MEETKPQVDVSYHWMKSPVAEWAISNWTVSQRDPMDTLQTSQAIAKAMGFSPQTDDKALLLKKPTQLIEHGEDYLVAA